MNTKGEMMQNTIPANSMQDAINEIQVSAMNRSLNPLKDLAAFISILRALYQLKPDIVHTHTSKAGLLGRIASKIAHPRAKVVHTFHGHLIYGYFARYKSIVFTIIEKVMSRFTDVAVAVTGETKKSLTSLGIGKNLSWRVIQIGVPIQNKPIKPLSEGFGLKILWVGRFTDIKDPFYALDAMKSISGKNDLQIELTMIGEGELFEKVKSSSVNLPIKFTGWMLNPFENIKEFDLLLLTSKNEGLPLVMLEAANYGRATLSRNVGGVGEFIKDGQSGYMVSGDSYKMAEKLKEIAQNKNSLKDVGLAANKLLGAEFSVEIMADKYFSLYSGLIVSN